MLILLSIVILAVVTFFIIGIRSGKKQRAEAKGKAVRANQALASGDSVKALLILSDALWVPSDGKYPPDDADAALNVVSCLEKALEACNGGPREQVAALKDALIRAKSNAAAVPESLTSPVEDFLDKLLSPEDIAEALLTDVKRNKANVSQSESEPDIEHTSEQRAIINKAGQLMLKRDLDGALAFLNQHLPSATQNFRAALLNQRGGCYAAQKNWGNAKSDFEECASLEPKQSLHCYNVAEALEKLGDPTGARHWAQKAYDFALNKRDRNDASAILNRVGSP